MKILMHYTVNQEVYNDFSLEEYVFHFQDRVNEIENFYKKYSSFQDNMFFILCFTCENIVKYEVGKIILNNENKYVYRKVSTDVKEHILEGLALKDVNTYDREVYYKEYSLDDREVFFNNVFDINTVKIKLKYYDWNELLEKVDILHNELIEMIFNVENVLKLASFYSPKNNDSSDILKKKYFNTLKRIGFISKEGINISETVLHGDIGEFLMHLLVDNFFKNESGAYFYPKLVFKSKAKISVFGNDGTIYLQDKKEIYFMEAKFYKNLADGINSSIESLIKHNESDEESIEVDLFRNIKTNNLNEIIEITPEVKEKFIVFIMCDEHYKKEDIIKIIESNANLNEFKQINEIIVFVLPILDKSKFLESFKNKSDVNGGAIYGKKC